MEQIAEVITYMHHNTFVHLDIKPENIMLNKNLDIKLVDFGAATD